jgi:glycerol-3-phosphate acyltransferase PlsY
MGGSRVTISFGGMANGAFVIAFDVLLGRSAVRLGRFFVDVRGLLVGVLGRFLVFLVFLGHFFPFRWMRPPCVPMKCRAR